MRSSRISNLPPVLGPLLLLCACEETAPVRGAGNESASTIRVVQTEDPPELGCRLTVDVPRDGGASRTPMWIDWANCSDFQVMHGVTIEELRETNQLADLPPDIVRTMTRNASKGLVMLLGEFAASVVYLDDAGQLREVMISD